jgi:hypothetical protein
MDRVTVLWGALLLGLLSASPGRAQVAAPSLMPAFPTVFGSPDLPSLEFVTPNPAAMKWDPSTRVGAAAGQLRISAPGSTIDYTLSAAGLRWASQRVSVAVEVLRAEDTDATLIDKTSVQSAAVAFLPTPWLAAGVGQAENDTSSNAVTELKDRVTGNSWGISARLDEGIYFGYGGGQERLQRTYTQIGASVDDTRHVTFYGVGYRQTGSIAVHVEAYRIERDPFLIPGATRGAASAVVLGEVNWRELLLGYRDTRTTGEDLGAHYTITSTTVSLGWAPRSGLAVVAHLAAGHYNNDFGTKYDADTRAVVVAYQF